MRDQARQTVSRRTFVSAAASTAFALTVVPSRVLGQDAPSNRLSIAAIGAGGCKILPDHKLAENEPPPRVLDRVEGGKEGHQQDWVRACKGGKDLITKESFAYFDLRLDWTIAKEGNSGIMFRVVEETEERNPWRLGAPVIPKRHRECPYDGGLRRRSIRHA